MRSGEVGVRARGGVPGGSSIISGMRGLAIASLLVPLRAPEPCAHRSGLGVSARRPTDEYDGFDAAAESGRGVGRNSCAFALRSRGELSGDAGKDDARYAPAIADV